MTSGQGCSKVGKRKRSISDLEDIENCGSPSYSLDGAEHQRKRLRDSPPSAPSSPPLTPLSTHNQCLTPEPSPCRSRSSSDWCSATVSKSRSMPSLVWLNRDGMIDVMSRRDLDREVNANYFQQHPHLTPQMRAVLLDWLMEVCEAYKLHRDTFYLSVNYLDRYLSGTKEVAKTELQLIGITCLFIASKVEEIYPPKLHEFAYVTNEACTAEDIVNQELLILTNLEWNISDQTVTSWLSLLLQIWHNKETSSKSILFPNHPVKDYLVTAQLLDLCILDEGSLRFPYFVLAASGIHLMTDFKDIIDYPFISWIETKHQLITECLRWMAPFAEVVRENSSPRKTTAGDYKLQSHHEVLSLLESVRKLQYSSVAMTPPPSSEKR